MYAFSAPAQGVVSWAWLNPISAVALPLLAFTLGLIAVWTVAERGVVRWIAYLQRIAAIYARGRFSVRPVQAERAPPEIRDLAETLSADKGFTDLKAHPLDVALNHLWADLAAIGSEESSDTGHA